VNITLIGSGRLATQLALALSRFGHVICQVCSPTLEHAAALARQVNAEATDSLGEIDLRADIYIIAVKDDALRSVAEELCTRIDKETGSGQKKLFLHTAGSIPMSIFEGKAQRYGVFYPMQTFSKERMVSFHEIPIFIESSDSFSLKETEALAKTISQNVVHFSSEQRKYLHLAAVFSCNFVNHCFTLADDILHEQGLDISVMLPLIRETVEKLQQGRPVDNQTGPAARKDLQVISSQEALLRPFPLAQEIYRLMSKSIMEHLTNGGTTPR
jgi:predicted short-subunit dehydrogenase-like oxidoreductase (DUF2520 family)